MGHRSDKTVSRSAVDSVTVVVGVEEAAPRDVLRLVIGEGEARQMSRGCGGVNAARAVKRSTAVEAQDLQLSKSEGEGEGEGEGNNLEEDKVDWVSG